ncbi:hypothetical protein BMT54_06505 [Pasteurellaceae bacterium 15-036681]|nr:hypothetical protein BMT54_06505 [Pasteurellaceae bacterium 15-036681]
MPETHYKEYELFYAEQPFGLWRDDYRTAQISHLLAMVNRNPKGPDPQLMDFMPFHSTGKGEEQIEDDGVAEYLAKR